MIGNQSAVNGMESGLNAVFTAEFGVLWLTALLFGIVFACLVNMARREGTLPKNPGDSAGFCVIGVAITGFIFGFWAGWELVVELMLFFIASGVPMLVESYFSALKYQRDIIKDAIHDTTETLAE